MFSEQYGAIFGHFVIMASANNWARLTDKQNLYICQILDIPVVLFMDGAHCPFWIVNGENAKLMLL